MNNHMRMMQQQNQMRMNQQRMNQQNQMRMNQQRQNDMMRQNNLRHQQQNQQRLQQTLQNNERIRQQNLNRQLHLQRENHNRLQQQLHDRLRHEKEQRDLFDRLRREREMRERMHRLSQQAHHNASAGSTTTYVHVQPEQQQEIPEAVPSASVVGEDGVHHTWALPPRGVSVVCPEGAGPGDRLSFQTPEGHTLEIDIPANMSAGQSFVVHY